MNKLVEWNESKYGENWAPDRSGVESMMTQIVAFEIKISKLDGKFKLSQQQNALIREKVAEQLLKSPSESVRETGQLMLGGQGLRNDVAKRNGDFILSSDKRLIQIDTVHAFMGRTHWAQNRTREIVAKSVENSLCYGIYLGDRQVGFARIVTDFCTFAYLCDVFIDEEYRGRGFSKWMIGCIMADDNLKGLRRFLLATKDAHKLYARYGFEPMSEDERSRFMGIRNDDV